MPEISLCESVRAPPSLVMTPAALRRLRSLMPGSPSGCRGPVCQIGWILSCGGAQKPVDEIQRDLIIMGNDAAWPELAHRPV